MPLITRTAKGSKLTIAEMDGNLEFLASSSFQDGVYSQTVEGTGEISGSFSSVFFFNNPISSGTAGTYIVSPTTNGSGTGAQLEITVVFDRGVHAINNALSSVLNGGSGYAIGDTLTVDLADLGGNAGETVVFTLQSGVDRTKTSTIEVTADEISLSTTNVNITGSITTIGSITVVGSIVGTRITALNAVEGLSLLIVNQIGDTVIHFPNLPTTDPVDSGQLWNDSGSLKISAGI